ncbi:hypothetical protein TNCV_1389251 [Trichonephila clavipes]|nr:hypothetical protein TNCV_1389251 [Trichonephila clavipes]
MEDLTAQNVVASADTTSTEFFTMANKEPYGCPSESDPDQRKKLTWREKTGNPLFPRKREDVRWGRTLCPLEEMAKGKRISYLLINDFSAASNPSYHSLAGVMAGGCEVWKKLKRVEYCKTIGRKIFQWEVLAVVLFVNGKEMYPIMNNECN